MKRMMATRIRSHVLQVGAAALASLSLTACNTARAPSAQISTPGAVFTALDGSARRAPLVSLPDAGRPVLVDEVRYAGGLRQQVRFGTSGENRADLTIGTAYAQAAPRLEKPTRTGIAAELASLGGRPYRVLNQPARNAYGPVGVALSDRCAYAWQWVDDIQGIPLGAARRGSGRVSASLRVHLCGRVLTTSADTLIADLARLRLGSVAQERVARQPRRRPAPKVAEALQNLEPATAPAVAPVVAGRPLVTVNASGTLVDILETAVPVGNAAQRGAAGRSTSPEIAVPRPDSANTASLSQPRYLMEPGQVRSATTLEAPRPVDPIRQEPLSADLPPQAYRGPTPPPFGW
ncbi:cellulose biosynthesis protein BcsN [Methylobacterium pseudosasicola]|uniref:Cellulose biosynthesis protein BcsN n=1 Tax=Methylobacterium pseudosasicola TaxID=582667 RepID=A0A1I4TP65_9HYPH|nr:cellulose biosynthesis protein BcsN [Methylobacterium pseudosasicola]SFM78370.1 hypothetical protein SAMN05192568_10566 [Methylobacterium pseudosasicola]